MRCTTRHLWLLSFLAICVTAGCQSAPTRPPEPKVSNGSQLAVIKFRDCVIKNDDDCDGSGDAVAVLVSSVLDDPPKMRAFVAARPVGAKDELSDIAAVAYGKSNGYTYVVNGEVLEFHRGIMFTTREPKIGFEVRILRTSDGQLVDTYGCLVPYDNETFTNAVIKSMTEDFQDSLEDINQGLFIHLLLSRVSCDNP